MVSSRPSSPAGTASAATAAPEVPPSSPDMHSRISSPSLPPSLSAPRSTVKKSEKTNKDEEFTPYSPGDDKSTLGGCDICSPYPVVLSADGDSDSRKSLMHMKGKGEPIAVSVVMEPGVFLRRNAEIEVEAGSAVQWVHHGGGDSAIPPTGHAQSVSESGVKSRHDGETESQHVGRICDKGLTVTIVAEDTDEPPVTRQVPEGGVCFHDLFDRPGSYTYYVCSSTVITGCIISKAPTSQPRVVEPTATVCPTIPSKSVISDDGSDCYTSPAGTRIPQMIGVPSGEDTTTVEGLGSSPDNKQLRHQLENMIDESRGRGYEGDESLDTLLVPPEVLMKYKTVPMLMPLNGATSKRIPDEMISAGDQICVSEAGETTGSPETVKTSPEPPSQKTAEYLTVTEDGVSELILVVTESDATGVADAHVEERTNIAGLPGRSPRSVVPPVAKAASPEASSQNTASSPPPEVHAAPESISALEESNLAGGNEVCINGTGTAAEKPEQGRKGKLPTVAGMMSRAGSSTSDMVKSKPLDNSNAPKAISVVKETDAIGQETVSSNVAGLVTWSQGHGHDGHEFTLSEAEMEAKSTPSDPTGSTQVDQVGNVPSHMTGSSSVAVVVAADRGLAPVDIDVGVGAACEVNEADTSPAPRPKSNEPSSCTTTLGQGSSVIDTFFSSPATTGDAIDAISVSGRKCAVVSIEKCINYISEVAEPLGRMYESDEPPSSGWSDMTLRAGGALEPVTSSPADSSQPKAAPSSTVKGDPGHKEILTAEKEGGIGRNDVFREGIGEITGSKNSPPAEGMASQSDVTNSPLYVTAASPDTMLVTEEDADAMKSVDEVRDLVSSTRLGPEITGPSSAMIPPRRATSASDINVSSTAGEGGAPKVISAVDEGVIVSATGENVNERVEVIGSPGRGSVNDRPSATGTASIADAWGSEKAGLPPVEQVSVFESISVVKKGNHAGAMEGELLAESSVTKRVVSLRPDGVSFPSLPPSLSAPRSTIMESENTDKDVECTPYSPGDDRSALGGCDVCYPAPVVLSEDSDRDNRTGNIEPTAVSVVMEPGVFLRRNAEIEVKAGSAVQWVRHGGGDSAIPPTGHAQSVSESGAESQHAGETESQPASRIGDNGLTVAIVAEETDEPPVTRQVPGGGVCFHDLFDRPGRYTYYVCSSAVITGRIVSKAPTSQPRVVEPTATVFPAIPSKSVINDDGSDCHTSPAGTQIPQMIGVPSNEGTATVEGLGSSPKNKQLRHQQVSKTGDSRGHGYENGEPQVDRAGSVQTDMATTMPVTAADAADGGAAPVDAEVGVDATCVNEANGVDTSPAQRPKSNEPASSTTSPQHLQLATASRLQEVYSFPLASDRSRAKSPARAIFEEKTLVGKSAAGEDVVQRSDNFLLSRLSQPVVPSEDSEVFFAQDYSGGEPSSVDSDDVPVESWIKGSAEPNNTSVEEAKPPSTAQSPPVQSPSASVAVTTPDEGGRIPSVSEHIVAEVLLRSSSSPREEPGSRHYVDGFQGKPGRELEGESPSKSPLNPRGHIGGTGTMQSSRPIDNDDTPGDESPKASVVGGDAEENVATSTQEEVEPATTGTKSTTMMLTAEDVRGTSEEESSGKTASADESTSLMVTAFTGGVEAIEEALGKGDGPAPTAPDTCDVPFSNPRSTSEYGIPPQGNDKDYAFESEETSHHAVKDASKAKSKGLDYGNGDIDNIHVVAIGADSTQPFDPELLRVPRGARVTWRRRDFEIGDKSEPEAFVLRLRCPIIEIGWRLVHSFSLSSAQPAFTFKFEEDGRFVVSNDAPPGLEKKRGEVEVEGAAGECGSSESFATSEDSGARSERFMTEIKSTSYDVKGDGERAAGANDFEKPSTPIRELGYDFKGKNKSILDGDTKATVPLDEAGDGRCNDMDSVSDPPASAPPVLSLVRTSKIAASRGKPGDLDAGAATWNRQVKGETRPDGESHVAGSAQGDGRVQDAVVAALVQPQEEVKEKPLPTKAPKSKKGNRKKKKAAVGSGAENNGGIGGVVSRHNASSSGFKHSAAVMLGEKGTYVQKFGDHAVGKEPVKTLVVSNRGFKPAKHLYVEVESIVSIKTASACPRVGDEQQSLYVVGPIAQKNRRSHEGSKKKDLERTFTHTITSEVPLEVVLLKPGEYWLVENSSSKRIRVTATPRELPEIPGSDCERQKAGSTQYVARLSAETASTETTKGNSDCTKDDVAFSSKNNKEDKGKLGAGAAPFTDATSASAGATATSRETKAFTSAQYENNTPGDGSEEQAREGISSQLSLRLPPVRVKGEGQRVSCDEYDGYNACFAAAVVQVSQPKGFELPKLQLGFAPGLGTLVVCELGARQRVTREVVCHYLACEANDREAMAQRPKGGKESTPASTEGSTAGEAPLDIDANNQVETDEDDTASVRLGPGTLSVCSFILGRFGSYRLSFRNDTSAGLTIVVCSPRNAPSPVSSVDLPSMKWPTSGEGINEARDRSQSRAQKGWRSGEQGREGTQKHSSQQISRGGRDTNSLARVWGRDYTASPSSWQPSSHTRANVKVTAAKPSTQRQQEWDSTNVPGSKAKTDCVSWSKIAAADGKQPPVQGSSVQRGSQAQHDTKSQAEKKQRSNEIKTFPAATLSGEAIPDEEAKKTLVVRADLNQVATPTAPVTSTKALKTPPAKMCQDISTSCSSTKGASHPRKVGASTGGLQSTSTENLVTTTEKVSTAAMGAASSDTTKSPVSASTSQKRCSALKKTRDVSREPKNRSKPPGATPSEDLRGYKCKLEAVKQANKGQVTVLASEKLVDSPAVGPTTATSQAGEPTGWPVPIQGASWSQEGVKPKACVGDDPQVERCGRSGNINDISTVCGREFGGMHSSMDESCTTRDVPGQPRSRRPRSSPLELAPRTWGTPSDVTVSQCRSVSPPAQARREPEMTDTVAPACSGWGPVSPSALGGNSGGWSSVSSAPASVEPNLSRDSVLESVGSGARKTAEPIHVCKEGQKESTPSPDQGNKTALPASTRMSKGSMSGVDSTTNTSVKKEIGKKESDERKAAPAVKAAATNTSACNAPMSPLSERTEWSSSSESTAEGARSRRAPRQRRADKECFPPIDPRISFGDYVPPGEEATPLEATTASAPCSYQRATSPSSSFGGDRAVDANPFSLSKDPCGWTTTVEDRDRTNGVGKTRRKSVRGGGSFVEECKNSTGVVRSVSEGGWGEDTTMSASAGAISPWPTTSGERPLRSSSGAQPAEKDINRALVEASVSDLANPEPATTVPAEGGTISTGTLASTNESTDHSGPKWGNYSTKISLTERVRRSEQLNGIRLPEGYQPDERVKSRPAAFPEASRQPNGDDWMSGDDGDILPPPSEYEKEETAIMMKRYDDIMERLRTTGYDEELPNGHRPKIYDLTSRSER